MNMRKRGAALLMCAALISALTLPAGATEGGAFAGFLIDAGEVDAPVQTIQAALYRRDGEGNFTRDVTISYETQVNRAAGEVGLFIQPREGSVWVEVDYLTDVDGDGVYELLEDEGAPVNDTLTVSGALTAGGGGASQAGSQTLWMSGEMLEQRGEQALRARRTPGSGQYLPGGRDGADSLLYLISVHRADGEADALHYYLHLYDTAILPSDVEEGSWYRDGVEFALARGLLGLTGEDRFSPGMPATRAMLWQALARLEGASLSGGEAWYSGAQSWVRANGLSDGGDPDGAVTREQLAVMLFRLAHLGETAPESRTEPEDCSDWDQVSPWATQAVGWAVEEGLLSGRGGGRLDPRGGASRAELAVMLAGYAGLAEG